MRDWRVESKFLDPVTQLLLEREDSIELMDLLRVVFAL
jgi:hypothetical protein